MAKMAAVAMQLYRAVSVLRRCSFSIERPDTSSVFLFPGTAILVERSTAMPPSLDQCSYFALLVSGPQPVTVLFDLSKALFLFAFGQGLPLFFLLAELFLHVGGAKGIGLVTSADEERR